MKKQRTPSIDLNRRDLQLQNDTLIRHGIVNILNNRFEFEPYKCTRVFFSRYYSMRVWTSNSMYPCSSGSYKYIQFFCLPYLLRKITNNKPKKQKHKHYIYV